MQSYFNGASIAKGATCIVGLMVIAAIGFTKPAALGIGLVLLALLFGLDPLISLTKPKNSKAPIL